MRPSRGGQVVVVAAVALTLAACDTVLGLANFSVIQCGEDASCGASEGGGPDVIEAEAGVYPPDAQDGPDAADAFDATEAEPPADASDAGDGWGSIGDDGPQVTPPAASQLWVHWPMPNPDAAIAPGSDAGLPHPMAYDMTAEAGDAGYVHDAVTHLFWEPGVGANISSGYIDADTYCRMRGQINGFPWRVPTRIELVSLIDFTRTPTFDVEAFGIAADAGPNAGNGIYWTSSMSLPDADALTDQHWLVSFANGLTISSGSGSWVRCVAGGSP